MVRTAFFSTDKQTSDQMYSIHVKAFPYVFQMLTLSSALSLKPRWDLMQKKQWPDQSWNLTHIRQQPVPETNSPPTVTRPGAEPTICKSDLQKVRPLPSVIFCFVLFSVVFFFFYFLATSQGMWDLSSQTRDRTHVPSIAITKCQPLDHQGSPWIIIFR